jgi:hypothetical protein
VLKSGRGYVPPDIWRTFSVDGQALKPPPPEKTPSTFLRNVIGAAVALLLMMGFMTALLGLGLYLTRPSGVVAAVPAVSWDPPGAVAVDRRTVSTDSRMRCSDAQQWHWKDAAGAIWAAAVSNCTDETNAARLAALIAASPWDFLLGVASAPKTPIRQASQIVSTWSQGPFLLAVVATSDTSTTNVQKAVASISDRIPLPTAQAPPRYPIGIAWTLVLALVIAFNLLPRLIIWVTDAYRIYFLGIEPDSGLPGNYEDAGEVAVISRLTVRIQALADLILLSGGSVGAVLTVRGISVGIGWVSIGIVIAFVMLAVGASRLVGFTGRISMPVLMPMSIMLRSRRFSVLFGSGLRLGVSTALYAISITVVTLLADVWLTVPTPVGVAAASLAQAATGPSGLCRAMSASVESIITTAPWAGGLVILTTWLVLVLLWRTAEKLVAIYADERVPIADLPAMLYLRSFDEDALHTDRSDIAQSWSERLLGRPRLRFEELMTRAASLVGPVDAIVDPRSASLTSGAARIVPTGDWRDSVRERAESALCLIVSATPANIGEGFAWELGHLSREIGHSRFCFVIGPWPIEERRRRLGGFLQLANEAGLVKGLTLDMVPDSTLLIAGTSSGQWYMSGGKRADAFTYAMSFLSIFCQLGESWIQEAAAPCDPPTRERSQALILTEVPLFSIRMVKLVSGTYRLLQYLVGLFGFSLNLPFTKEAKPGTRVLSRSSRSD